MVRWEEMLYCHFIRISFFFFSPVFLGPHPWHIEVPRLGVELELQPLAYTTAVVMLDPSPTEQGQGLNLRPHGY